MEVKDMVRVLFVTIVDQKLVKYHPIKIILHLFTYLLTYFVIFKRVGLLTYFGTEGVTD